MAGWRNLEIINGDLSRSPSSDSNTLLFLNLFIDLFKKFTIARLARNMACASMCAYGSHALNINISTS